MMNKYSRQPGDSILALLEPGEYVLNRNAVEEIGRENLDELNYEDAPRFDMSQRGQFQSGGMLGDMMGYQTGGISPESYVNRGPIKQKKGEFSREYIFELPTDEGDRFYSAKAKSDRRQSLQAQKDKALQDAIMKMETTPSDSIPSGDVEKYFDKKGLKGILGGILGMQSGGSTLSYGGATTTGASTSFADLYEQMGMTPNEDQKEQFEKQYKYDPSREGVLFEDYSRAMTGATQAGRQNLMGAGQQMQQAQAKSGFAGGGAGQQAQGQARDTIMQDFLAQEGAAKSSLFKGIRGEREQWMRDAGAGLSSLQSDEGTVDTSTSIEGTPIVSVLPTQNEGTVTYNGSLWSWSEEEGAYVQV